jgi:hypothetical protein
MINPDKRRSISAAVEMPQANDVGREVRAGTEVSFIGGPVDKIESAPE